MIFSEKEERDNIMENALEIRKRIKKIYIELICFSVVVVGIICRLEYCILTSNAIKHESMVCFLFSIVLIDAAIIAVINVFLIIRVVKNLGIYDYLSNMPRGMICKVFLYIVTVILLIVNGIKPDNKMKIFGAILLAIFIAAILEWITSNLYNHIYCMSKLYYYSCFFTPFYKNYEEKIQNYNSCARRYNSMYYELTKITERLRKEPPEHIMFAECEPSSVPQYDVANIHLLSCTFGWEYIREAGDYISAVEKEMEQVEQSTSDIEIILNQKENYICQLKRNSDRLDDPRLPEESKKIFSDILNKGYNQNKKLAKRSRFERRIKPPKEEKR